MPGEASVVLLADRGFVGRQLCRYVRDRWNWHYRIRIKGKFWFWCPGKGWRQIQTFHLNRGEAWLLQHVSVHQTDSLADVHLAGMKPPVASIGTFSVVNPRPYKPSESTAKDLILKKIFSTISPTVLTSKPL